MSLRAHLWALDNAPVKNPTAVLVLVALADEADDRGRGACAFVDKIAERARCSKRAAQNHLRDLYRSRVINFGDSIIAEQRFKLSAGRCPRVWDLNLDATWSEVPQPRTAEEMLAEYSDQIGLRPARRGVQNLHPGDGTADDTLGGVQNLHPSEETAAEQAKEDDVDNCFDDHANTDLHPRGADGCTPGVQTAAPYPLGSAYTRSTPPPVLDLTLGAEPAQSGGEDAPQKEKTPDIRKVARWFVTRMRTDWTAANVESALTIAMNERKVSLTTAAQALRELLTDVDRYGKTNSPYRLRLDESWWTAVRPKTAAAQKQLAAEPRCHQPGHEPFPAARCVACMTDGYAPLEIAPDPKAEAEAAAFVKALRQRQRTGTSPGLQGALKAESVQDDAQGDQDDVEAAAS